MEPALKDGDVVLVRKSDVLPGLFRSESLEDATERARIMRRDGNVTKPFFFHRPPVVLAGDVAVFRNPTTAFPSEYNIKRVVALGDQLVSLCCVYVRECFCIGFVVEISHLIFAP